MCKEIVKVVCRLTTNFTILFYVFKTVAFIRMYLMITSHPWVMTLCCTPGRSLTKHLVKNISFINICMFICELLIVSYSG